MADSRTTTDHDEIRAWAEARDGQPAAVRASAAGEDGSDLRIDFADGADEPLERISWDEFFEAFDERNLAFLYQEETASGEASRFFELVGRS